MSLKIPATMPQKCRVCGKDIKVGDTITKFEDGHWCKDENCGKTQSLPKVEQKPPANQPKDQPKIKVFGADESKNKPDIDPVIVKKSRDIEKMFEVCMIESLKALREIISLPMFYFVDKDFANKQNQIMFSVLLKGAMDNWNK